MEQKQISDLLSASHADEVAVGLFIKEDGI